MRKKYPNDITEIVAAAIVINDAQVTRISYNEVMSAVRDASLDLNEKRLRKPLSARMKRISRAWNHREVERRGTERSLEDFASGVFFEATTIRD